MTEPRATDNGDGTFTLAIRSWSGTYAMAKLPGQVALYTTLRDRRGGKYSSKYSDTVRALKRLLAASSS